MKNKIKNKVKITTIIIAIMGIVGVMGVMGCVLMAWMPVYAAEGTVSGQIMQLDKKAAIYSEKSVTSDVLATFNAGDVIFVTGQTDDGWYTVAYQGETGYLPADASGAGAGSKEDSELKPYTEADVESVDEELKQTNIESTYLAEEVVRYHKARRNAIIWVCIITALAIALVEVGYMSYKRKSVVQKENEDRTPDDENVAENSMTEDEIAAGDRPSDDENVDESSVTESENAVEDNEPEDQSAGEGDVQEEQSAGADNLPEDQNTDEDSVPEDQITDEDDMQDNENADEPADALDDIEIIDLDKEDL